MFNNPNIFTRTCEISEGEEQPIIQMSIDEFISKTPEYAIDYVKGLTVFANDTYLSTEDIAECSDGARLANICLGDWYVSGSAIKFIEDGYYVNFIENPDNFEFFIKGTLGNILEVK